MTNEELEQLINDVNSGAAKGRVFSRPLKDNVRIGTAWLQDHAKGWCMQVAGFPVFLLFQNDKCVGIVLDMGPHDFHVYTLKAYRKQHFMYRALKDVVLPHMIHVNRRPKQSCQFDNEASRKLLKKLGFLVDAKSRTATIGADKVASVEFKEVHEPFPIERYKPVLDRIVRGIALLSMARDELNNHSLQSVNPQPLDLYAVEYLKDAITDCFEDTGPDVLRAVFTGYVDDVYWLNAPEGHPEPSYF